MEYLGEKLLTWQNQSHFLSPDHSHSSLWRNAQSITYNLKKILHRQHFYTSLQTASAREGERDAYTRNGKRKRDSIHHCGNFPAVIMTILSDFFLYILYWCCDKKIPFQHKYETSLILHCATKNVHTHCIQKGHKCISSSMPPANQNTGHYHKVTGWIHKCLGVCFKQPNRDSEWFQNLAGLKDRDNVAWLNREQEMQNNIRYLKRNTQTACWAHFTSRFYVDFIETRKGTRLTGTIPYSLRTLWIVSNRNHCSSPELCGPMALVMFIQIWLCVRSPFISPKTPWTSAGGVVRGQFPGTFEAPSYKGYRSMMSTRKSIND